MPTITENRLTGHIVALFTIFVWGVTFISTKILLRSFSPYEILLIRFFIGWLALFALAPRRIKNFTPRTRLICAGAGLTGVTLYFLLENIALEYTTASNAAIIVSLAPFFTALVAFIFLKTRKPEFNFYVGFVLSMSGVVLISYNPGETSLNPLGDALALLAAVAWAFYSALIRELTKSGIDTLTASRAVFFYGLLFMAPLAFWLPISFPVKTLFEPINLANILFLGVGASALCFASWTFAIKRLGVVRSSLYIYLVPGVTVVVAAFVLREPLTQKITLGVLLTVAGLLYAERSKTNPDAGDASGKVNC